MEIEGALALVTGGAKGLGLVIARHLFENGAKVIVLDVDVDALGSLPHGLLAHTMDVTSITEVKGVIQSLVEEYGSPDILVNNAGMIYSEPLINIMNPAQMAHDYERFRKCLTINLDSVFIVTSAIVEHMVCARRHGVVINVSSISACGNEGQTAYSAAKAGVEAMTVTWAKELGRLGIRSNAIAPGFINTVSTRDSLRECALEHIVSSTPLRRLGEPHDVAFAVSSLIQNDFMNGVILKVDGGLRI